MTLRTRTIKQYIPKIIWVTFFLVVSFFILKTALWEREYYTKMEGRDRAVATSQEGPKIDETEPTKEEVESWASTLPENYPAYITIDALGAIGRQIIPVGTLDTGELDTPNNIYQIGWYENSSVPGGGGTIVLDGHNGGPNVQGVLKNLPDVPTGAYIYIEAANGKSYKYRVVENKTIPLSESNTYMSTAFASPESKKESLTLITCTGEWSAVRQTYLSRQFLRAVLEK